MTSLEAVLESKRQRVRPAKTSEALIFTCQSLLTDASLIDLLFNSDLGRLSAKEPYLQLAKSSISSIEIKKTHFKTAGTLWQAED